MFAIFLFVIVSIALTSSVTLAGPANHADECKDVKKEVQSLQEPKIRGSATEFCSQYLNIQELTDFAEVYAYSTDFAGGPETTYPYVIITAPPGTITETDTIGITTATETILLTQYYACPSASRLCPVDWDKSTVLLTAIEPTPSTSIKTVAYAPNPLPKADPSKLTKACECLSIPNPMTTVTETYTYVYAPYTITAALETYTDYAQVELVIKTITVPVSTSTVTLPVPIYPHYEFTTEYFPWPIIRETVTVYPASQTSRLKSTKRPSQPTRTKGRTTHVHPNPRPTPPPRKGKGHKGDKGRD